VGWWQEQTKEVMRICRDTFTTDVAYDPKVGANFSIKGIFDAAYQQVEILDGAAVQTVKPVVGVRLADFPSPPVEGDRCTINGTLYRIAVVAPDGEAGARLELNKL
jgi:hypothetical protein